MGPRDERDKLVSADGRPMVPGDKLISVDERLCKLERGQTVLLALTGALVAIHAVQVAPVLEAFKGFALLGGRGLAFFLGWL